MRKLFRKAKAGHKHEWEYFPKTTGGWGLVRCKHCPDWDIW